MIFVLTEKDFDVEEETKNCLIFYQKVKTNRCLFFEIQNVK